MVEITIPASESPQPDQHRDFGVEQELSLCAAEQAIRTAMLLPFGEKFAALSKRMEDINLLLGNNGEVRVLALSALAEVANYGNDEERAQARKVAAKHVPYLVAAKDGEEVRSVTDALRARKKINPQTYPLRIRGEIV